MRVSSTWSGAVAALLLALPASIARADEVAQFYQGKTVSIIVSVEVGGLYSTFATILARHLGGHMPGRPTVIVQHMPGAGGSLKAASTGAFRNGSGNAARLILPFAVSGSAVRGMTNEGIM